jgi:hypothetical protein
VTHENPLRALLDEDPRDAGCAAAFERLDEYVEIEVRGEDAAARLPDVAAHLRACAACDQDRESLLALVRRRP